MARPLWRKVMQRIGNRADAEALLDRHRIVLKHGKDGGRRTNTRGLVPGSEAHVEVKAALNWLNLLELGVVVEVDRSGPKVKATAKPKTKKKKEG